MIKFSYYDVAKLADVMSKESQGDKLKIAELTTDLD